MKITIKNPWPWSYRDNGTITTFDFDRQEVWHKYGVLILLTKVGIVGTIR